MSSRFVQEFPQDDFSLLVSSPELRPSFYIPSRKPSTMRLAARSDINAAKPQFNEKMAKSTKLRKKLGKQLKRQKSTKNEAGLKELQSEYFNQPWPQTWS